MWRSATTPGKHEGNIRFYFAIFAHGHSARGYLLYRPFFRIKEKEVSKASKVSSKQQRRVLVKDRKGVHWCPKASKFMHLCRACKKVI